MSESVISGIGGSLSGAIASHVLLGRRRTTDRQTAAANDLAASLNPLIRLTHASYRSYAGERADWLLAMNTFLVAERTHRGRLPFRWGHLGQSVRFAMGEAAALTFADRDDASPLTIDFHPKWMQFADDYLVLVQAYLRQWADTPPWRRRRMSSPLTYDNWLRRSGRYVGL